MQHVQVRKHRAPNGALRRELCAVRLSRALLQSESTVRQTVH